MDNLSPDFFPDFPGDSSGEAQPDTQVALVSTLEPLFVKVAEIDDDRIPDGLVCMGSYIEGRLIARSAVPPEMIVDFRNREIFDQPVRIALAAVEQAPGLQCRLFALLPASHFQPEEEEPEEPWVESVPRFESASQDRNADAVIPLLLGHIVRFSRDRKHPDDLAAEAADVLQTIIADTRPMGSVVDKILEDLLE